MIPGVLEFSCDTGIRLEEIGELVDDEGKSILSCKIRHFLTGLSPCGVGEVDGSRVRGMGKVVDGLRERSELVEGGGRLGHPVE
jgi:hypothetical protein